MLVRVPEKFQRLSPFQAGQRVTELVSFVDLSPTFLSLADLDIPAQLYDLAADPWEINNLAADRAHAEKLAALRDRLEKTMIETHDTGLISEPLFDSLAAKSTIADYAQSAAFDIQKIAALAFTASAGDLTNILRLKEAITSKDPVETLLGRAWFPHPRREGRRRSAFRLRKKEYRHGSASSKCGFQHGSGLAPAPAQHSPRFRSP